MRSTPSSLGTDYKFTGQREEASLGLYFFVARWLRSAPEAERRGFDPSLGRFTSPDTIVPTSTQGTQAWDRYAFVNNNPVRYNDPTGHMQSDPEDETPTEDKAGSGDDNNSDCNTETNTNSAGQSCHDYWTTANVCLAIFQCTPEEISRYMAMFQYPGQWPGSPVVVGEGYTVFPEQIWGVRIPFVPSGLGAITVGSPGSGTLVNNAEPSHIFYQGSVTRTATQLDNGSWSIVTHGTGANIRTPFAGVNHLIDIANQRIGAPAFNRLVDRPMVLYITIDQFIDDFVR